MLRLGNIIFLLFFTGGLFSCYKLVPVDIPPHSPELVANALFKAGKEIEVNISISQHIYDTLSPFDNQALVTIRTGDNIEVLEDLGKGNYTTKQMIAISGKTYVLEVSSNGYPSIVAKDSVPETVPFRIVRFIPGAKINEDGYEYSLFEIAFSDPANTKNFYEIMGRSLSVFGLSKVYLTSDDPYVLNEGDKDFYPSNILLSDELFDGKKVNLIIYAGYQKEYDKAYYIFFRCVSAAYYHYEKKLLRHMENQYPDLWDGTGSPVTLFSNVENGYGIFAAYTQQIDSVSIPQ